MNFKQIIPLALLLGLSTTAVVAQDQDEDKVTLKIGDPAPKLQNGKWIQGDPVDSFAKDKVYLVEFWATWCGPCKVSIPHLNEIHQKYKDKGLVVIGQDCWERDDAKVAPFVKQMAEKMTYRVALDDKSKDKNGSMAKTWMAAAGQNGIPTAFIVEKTGKVAWIGHPMTLEDAVIDDVLAGKYDIQKAAEKFAQEKMAEKKAEEDSSRLQNQLAKAMQNKDWDKAQEAVKEMAKDWPEARRDAFVNQMNFRILVGKGDLEGAATAADKLSEKVKSNAMAQNDLAWTLLTQEGLKGQALDTAAKIAERANDAAGGKDAAILDTLARARFLQGNKDEALTLQKKAVSLAEGDMKDELQKSLESYQAGKLPAAE
jgi:thiol-disulfide isomerase/thioredoxin